MEIYNHINVFTFFMSGVTMLSRIYRYEVQQIVWLVENEEAHPKEMQIGIRCLQFVVATLSLEWYDPSLATRVPKIQLVLNK